MHFWYLKRIKQHVSDEGLCWILDHYQKRIVKKGKDTDRCNLEASRTTQVEVSSGPSLDHTFSQLLNRPSIESIIGLVHGLDEGVDGIDLGGCYHDGHVSNPPVDASQAGGHISRA